MEENNQTSMPTSDGQGGSSENSNQPAGDNPEVKTESPVNTESAPETNPENTPNYPIEEGGKSKTAGVMKMRSILRTLVLIVVIVAVVWFFNLDGKDNGGEILGDEENGTAQEQTGDDEQVEDDQNSEPADDSNNDTAETVIEDNSGLVEVTAYYAKGGECNEVFGVKRMIEKKYDQDIVNTIRGLLTPLTESEIAMGYTTNVPVGTYLTNVFVDGNGQATVKLSKILTEAGDACAVTSAQAQVEQTLLQFSYVKSVVIE